MKKFLSMLIALTFVLGLTFTASAKATKVVSPTVEKTGVIKTFNATSVVMLENGKSVAYGFMKDAKIVKNGEEVSILDAAQKGLKVKYKVVTTKGKGYISYMELPNSGSIYEGIPGTSMSVEVNTTVAYQETSVSKVTKNSNNLIEASTLSVNKEKEVEYDTFEIQSNGSVLYIGAVLLVPNSIKLTIGGKAIKVIEGTTEFDKAVTGDEAKLAVKSGVYTLNLETPLTAEQIKDRDNTVKLTYKTKEYEIQRLELSNLVVNEDVVCELNGKEVSYAKAMYRGNYAAFTTNESLEIIYVNAYYKNIEASVAKVSETSITVNVLKGGRVAYTETLAIDPGCTITNKLGEDQPISNVRIGSRVLLSTSPELGYSVSEIVIQ